MKVNYIIKEKIESLKKKVNDKYAYLKYKRKLNKLHFSRDLFETIYERKYMEKYSEIINCIEKSKDIEEFGQNIIALAHRFPIMREINYLLVGNILGTYILADTTKRGLNYYHKSTNDYLSNFNHENKDKILKILRANFYRYVMDNNRIKLLFYRFNEIYPTVSNYLQEFSEEQVLKMFDEVASGKDLDDNYEVIKSIVYEYIYTVVSNYPIDDIINHYDFINYDLFSKGNESLDERRKKYLEHDQMDEHQLIQINDLELLKKRLKSINTQESKKLLERLESINDPYKDIDKISSIYAEYEILFREDIVSKLFVPTEQETIISDFRDVRPQLIHGFFRDQGESKPNIQFRIIREILAERVSNKIDLNIPFNEIEQKNFIKLFNLRVFNSKESYDHAINNKDVNRDYVTIINSIGVDEIENYKKRLNLLEQEFNPTKVNYSYESVGRYEDSYGMFSYLSDTSNQIAASLYSEKYYCQNNLPQMIGIGFNEEGLLPEGIALSSEYYLTTNKGLTHLEVETKDEFLKMSSSYDELIQNDGNSEIVLFRRNIDYDTKASYIFVAFNSEDNECKDIIERGRKLAQDNNMKLVLYDIVKIRESYRKYSESINEEIEDSLKR